MQKLSKLAWSGSCFLVALIFGAPLGWSYSYQPTPPEPDRGSGPSESNFLGVSSCSSTGCHNANTYPGTKGSEYSTWISSDPHSRAFGVLYGDRSRLILKNHRALSSIEEAHPEKDPLCLSCHVQPNPDLRGVAIPPGFALADGVACEACHGPAKDWVAQHYSLEWSGLSAKTKASMGFTNTKNLLERAKLCTGCHVGKEGMDVNHDLIAAGHPRLRFELGAYLANYTSRHWSVNEEKKRNPDFEEKTWILGQMVSSQAALDLLATRAEAGKADRPWPELAEFNCASCHHPLGPLPGKLETKVPIIGLPVWGTWNHSGLKDIATGLGDPIAKDFQSQLENLEKLVRSSKPRTNEISAKARFLSGKLGEIINRTNDLAIDSGRSKALLEILVNAAPPGPDWESATQRYLGLMALTQSLKDQGNAPKGELMAQGIRKIGASLEKAFPSGRESLSGSPDLYDPGAVRDLFDQLKNIPR